LLGAVSFIHKSILALSFDNPLGREEAGEGVKICLAEELNTASLS
jgi:hypothetical protein